MVELSPAATAYRAGLFGDVLRCLSVANVRDPDSRVLEAQAKYYLGQIADAKAIGERVLKVQEVSATLVARCLTLIAAIHRDEGRHDEALATLTRALQVAEQAGDLTQVALVSIDLLERSCDMSGYSASLWVATRARRAALRSGDSQAIAALHLTFARLEARAGNLDLSRRHCAMARALLDENPNACLAATLDLDESGVVALAGDVQAAVVLASRGAQNAARSGWSKGVLVGAANLAQLFVAMGRIEEAEKQLAIAHSQTFQSPTYSVVLADTRAQIAFHRGELATAESILIELSRQTGVPSWYQLAARQTLVRTLLQQGRCHDAIRTAQEGTRLARAAGLGAFAQAFALQVAEAEADVDSIGDARTIEVDGLERNSQISLVGSRYLVIGKVFTALQRPQLAALHLSRALRVLDSASDPPLRIAARAAVDELARTRSTSIPSDPAPPDLYGVVALLELAGHPHILGREAFAVIVGLGCARAVALVARGADGPRIVDATGWSTDEALKAARTAEPPQILSLGAHRGETWQILTDPRPELDQRCTLAAVRKLLATACTLDQYRRDEKQRAALWPAEALDSDPESIWVSEQSAELLAIARRIAPTPLAVLLTGETGTGKEMLARAIHRASDRAERPFLPFNCSAVPRDMLESQLFGYRKGAFTGADASFPGVIRGAAGGTLFLDEIADVGLELQPKLLRFLENYEIHPIGEPSPVKVDVRIVAATNGQLEQLVTEGRFREDLFYRLNVVRLRIPPLRERREEIPQLVHHYLRRFGDEQKKGHLTLSDELLEYLLLYSWPGNIRQLANEVRRLVALAEPGATLTPALLSPEILASRKTIAVTASDVEVRVRVDQPLPNAVDLLEQLMVRRALERSHGRVEEASRLLGISRKGLFLKRRRWGLSQAS